MIKISDLIHVADAYKSAAGIDRDSTVAHRVFGDSKKLTALRGGAQLTVSRFNDALLWFASNWPEGSEVPEILADLVERKGAA